MYRVMVDGHRRTYLILSWGPEVVEWISMERGIIEVAKVPTEMCCLLEEIDRTPEDLARIYLSTTLDKEPRALRILKQILGLEVGPAEPEHSVKNKTKCSMAPGMVSLGQICDEFDWDSSDARRMLRKAGMKPGEAWEWKLEEKDAIAEFLRKKLATIKNRSYSKP